jgi:hypothetical protein
MAINPTGANFAPQPANPIFMPASDSSGGPGNMNFGNTQNPAPPMPPEGVNPYGGGTSTTGVAPVTGSSSTFPTPAAPVANPTGSPAAGTPVTPKQLAPTITSGLAGPVSGFLNSEGGYNAGVTQQNVDAQIAAMQHDIQLGEGNLQTNLAEAGISPNSSVSALETSNYESNAVTQENSLVAQDYFNMWNASQNREASMLESLISPAAAHQQNTSFMGRMGQVFGDIGQIFGGSATYDYGGGSGSGGG